MRSRRTRDGFMWTDILLLVAVLLCMISLYHAAGAKEVQAAEKAEAVEVVPELETLGRFKLTFYCPCKKCSGRWGRQTASGATCTEGRTVAVDKRVIPLGTRLIINGEEYIAEDTGVYGRSVDIFLEDHDECKRRGIEYAEVWRVGR